VTGERSDVAFGCEVLPRESELRRWLRVGGRIFATSFDIGFLLLGTALLGLAVAIVLDGLGVASVGLTSSVAEMLGSALVVSVLGAFGLGVAVEGPIHRGVEGFTVSHFEQAVLRAVSLMVVGIGLVLLGRLLDQYTADLPVPFEVVTKFVASVGFAGMTVTAVVGVLAVWGMQRLTPRPVWAAAELPILYGVWALSAAFIFVL
jgi:small-conductance mechanosensitive channel